MQIYEKLLRKEARLSLVGLGYVGLPIALAFARKISVIGFDINAERIEMMKKGIDISGYRACQLDNDMIRKADLILVMESSHKSAIEKFEPYAKGKVFLLGNWGGGDIPDPYQQNLSAFVKSFNLIERGISEWLKKL